MAFLVSSMPIYSCSSPININSSSSKYSSIKCHCIAAKCELGESSKDMKLVSKGSKLGIGSPIVVVEAPKMIKTAASVPCLRVNADLVKPGDVGRCGISPF
ncbi:hypothetical protein ACH5RR_029224 [Cinchona calisaya]|uniref:Uncharacterized protein n=1 Tax=Cinchona calisaya TaxID=153742 RepID=A0ABD2YW98_9GENT